MGPTDAAPPPVQEPVTVSEEHAPVNASPLATSLPTTPTTPDISELTETPSYASSETAPVPAVSEKSAIEEKKVDGGVQELAYGSPISMTEQELRESKYLTGRTYRSLPRRRAPERLQRDSSTNTLFISTGRLALVFTGMLLAIFLVALDQT
jgi:hypothetical protein